MAVTFDTLKFSRRLRAAGIPEAQADATAEAFADATGQELATRSDIALFRGDVASEFAAVRAEMASGFAAVRAEMTLQGEQLNRRIDGLDGKIDQLAAKLTIRLGAIMAASVAAVAAIARFL